MSTKQRSGREFLGAYKPPKDVSKMSEAELDAFAESVADAMTRAYGRLHRAGEPATTVAGGDHTQPQADDRNADKVEEREP